MSTTPTVETGDAPHTDAEPSGSVAGFVRRRWKLLLAGGVVVAAGLAWLAFGYFGVHTLFIDDKVDEAGPVFDSGAVATGDEVDAVPPADDGVAPEEDAADPVGTLAQGTFVDRSHPTSGTAVVLSDGTEQRFLRFEDFATDNGPDLNVYLTTAPPDADTGAIEADFVDLGDLKGNIGDQNYEIPPDVDLGRYSTVVVWCVRFSVAFGAAGLT